MKYVYLLPFILLVGQLQAQEPVSFNITQNDGMPSNTVFDIFQDSDGFLWIATANGITRYNGITFRNYNSSTARSKAVGYISEDNDNRIWFHNFFGEILYIQNDSIQKLESWEKYYDVGFPGITNNGDSLIINSPKHIFIYNIAEEKWIQLDTLFSINGKEEINFTDHEKIGSTEWVSFSEGDTYYVQSFNRNDLKYSIPYGTWQLYANTMRMIEFRDKIWLFDRINSLLFELDKGEVKNISKRYEPYIKNARQIKRLENGEMAFYGADGCYILDNNDHWITLVRDKNVSSITQDNEGAYWIGTLNEGVFYVPDINTSIFKKDEFGLFTELAIDLKHEQLVAGNYDGSISFFSNSGIHKKKIPSIFNKEVQSLFVDSQSNRLLFFSDKLYQINLDNGHLDKTIVLTSTKKIFRFNNHYGFVTSGGIYEYDLNFNFVSKGLGYQRLSTAAYLPSEKVLYVGTQKGLTIFDPISSDSKLWYPSNQNFSPGVSSIICRNDTVFIGTYTNGIYIIKDGIDISHLTINEGLPSDNISSLVLESNKIYIGTDRGVAIYNQRTKNVSLIDETKALAGNEIYDLKMLPGQLWISHTNGLQYYQSNFGTNEVQPKIHLQQVSSDDNKILDYYNGITLQPFTYQLKFNFDVSNNLKSRGKTNIYYRIKELNNNKWNSTLLSSPIANFLSLPSGKYTFEAYAVNEDGVKSTNMITIPLNILAPFWQQGWFIALVFILSLLIIGSLIYLRFKRLNERIKHQQLLRENQQNMQIAQLTSIRAQMNPHFIFNTMSLIQGRVLNGLKQEANDTIQDFSILMRNVLDFSSKETILMTEEIEVLQKYLAIEKERFNGLLEYQINIDQQLQNELIKIPSLITQPFVENALRHGLLHKEGLKKLTIDFYFKNENIIVQIDDNGIGRSASAEFNKSRKKNHISFATEAYKRRIDLFNELKNQSMEIKIIDKTNNNGFALGTTVLISIPLNID